MSPVPLCLEKWGGHDPPAPMGAPPLTSHQSLTLNISQTATDTAIVTIEGKSAPKLSNGTAPISMILSDL